MDVKRYDIFVCTDGPNLEESATGRLMFFEDHERVVAAMKAEIAELRGRQKEYRGAVA